jgi:hypothetical protein
MEHWRILHIANIAKIANIANIANIEMPGAFSALLVVQKLPGWRE